MRALALHYVGRYATTRARLVDYLRRKLRERGWADDTVPPVEAIADSCVASGYVDDASFAEAKARGLAARGYGGRRIALALHTAGVARDLATQFAPDPDSAFDSAETYARRRRIGAFALSPPDDRDRRRQFAAMIRAGHSFELAAHFTKAALFDDTGDKT